MPDAALHGPAQVTFHDPAPPGRRGLVGDDYSTRGPSFGGGRDDLGATKEI